MPAFRNYTRSATELPQRLIFGVMCGLVIIIMTLLPHNQQFSIDSTIELTNDQLEEMHQHSSHPGFQKKIIDGEPDEDGNQEAGEDPFTREHRSPNISGEQLLQAKRPSPCILSTLKYPTPPPEQAFHFSS